MIHDKFELGFCLVLILSKLFYIPDQGLGSFWHLVEASGGVGYRSEVCSRSGGHALIPDDACCFSRLGEKGDNPTEGEMSGGYGGSGERGRR